MGLPFFAQLTFGKMLRRTSLLLMAVLLLLVACGPRANTPSDWSTWKPIATRYATKFKVWARGDDRLVVVFGNGGERDTVGCYLISSDPRAHLPIDAVLMAKPVGRLAMLSTTHVPYISALGRVGTVVAGAHLDQVRDTDLLAAIQAGKVKEIGTGQGVDRERMLALDLGAVFTYSFGKSEIGALEALGIPVVEVSEYLEEHPLGRAEWLRFFGVILGEEHKADSLFAGIVQRYELVRSRVRRDTMPTVLFGSCWNGQWFVPPGNSYMAKLIDDAGGRYVFADRTGDGNITVDMETMITVGGNADVWGMISAERGPIRSTAFTAGDERLEKFRSVSSRNLFAASSDADFFGKALIEPDVLLQDMCCCLRSGQCPVEHAVQAVPGYFMPASVDTPP